jgi:DMSO/TMAO reductase YedYZ molybdopterin-dependent catalytic subunit
VNTRRRFLIDSSSLALLLGCNPVSDEPITSDSDVPLGDCPDELTDATFVGTLNFGNEDGVAVGSIEGEGLSGRLALDHSELDDDTLVTDNADFFIRTRAPAGVYQDGWPVAVEGVEVLVSEIAAQATDQGVVLLECSGNGSNRHFGLISAAQWAGVPILDLLDDPGDHVIVEGFDDHPAVSGSTPGAAWVFPVEELTGAFLATEMNGEPLPLDHGAPVRLINPGWYGCCNIKWVQRVQTVSDDEPATSQMKEFAPRTHQSGTPALAADYIPATMDLAAMPIRVEEWELDGDTVFHVVGIYWGGDVVSPTLTLHANDEQVEVQLCVPREHTRTWGIWSAIWRPESDGKYELTLSVAEDVSTRRLDTDFYLRTVSV